MRGKERVPQGRRLFYTGKKEVEEGEIAGQRKNEREERFSASYLAGEKNQGGRR